MPTILSKPLRHNVWGKAPKSILELSPRIAELASQFAEQRSSGGKFHPGQDVQTVFGPESQLGRDLIAVAQVAGLERPEFRDIIDVRNFCEKLKGLAPESWLEGGKRVAIRLPPKYQKTSIDSSLSFAPTKRANYRDTWCSQMSCLKAIFI